MTDPCPHCVCGTERGLEQINGRTPHIKVLISLTPHVQRSVHASRRREPHDRTRTGALFVERCTEYETDGNMTMVVVRGFLSLETRPGSEGCANDIVYEPPM